MKLFHTYLFVFFNLLLAGFINIFIKTDVVQLILTNHSMRMFVFLCSFLILNRLVDTKSFLYHTAIIFIFFYYNIMMSDLYFYLNYFNILIALMLSVAINLILIIVSRLLTFEQQRSVSSKLGMLNILFFFYSSTLLKAFSQYYYAILLGHACCIMFAFILNYKEKDLYIHAISSLWLIRILLIMQIK